MTTKTDHSQVIQDFKKSVNMTPGEIEKWLKTAESNEVGQKSSENAESVGHESGRHIIKILEKKQDEYSEADFKHMQKVNSYVSRHLAQGPKKDVEQSNWRYSLMNWGHDPCKKR